MTHSEFSARLSDPRFRWGVQHRELLRNGGLLCVLAFAFILLASLAPTFVYLFLSDALIHPLRLVWLPVAIAAANAGVPSLNLIDSLPWWILGCVSALLGFWLGPYVLGGGVSCLATWYASGVLRGTAMMVLRERLLWDKRLFDHLNDRGCLLLPGA